MCVGWRQLSIESAGDGEKRLWLQVYVRDTSTFITND